MSTTQIITLGDHVSIEDARAFFTTAVIVAGAIHGTPSLLLTDKPSICSRRREVRFDCSRPVGECAARAFIGLMAHHHGGNAVSVARDGGVD